MVLPRSRRRNLVEVASKEAREEPRTFVSSQFFSFSYFFAGAFRDSAADERYDEGSEIRQRRDKKVVKNAWKRP